MPESKAMTRMLPVTASAGIQDSDVTLLSYLIVPRLAVPPARQNRAARRSQGVPITTGQDTTGPPRCIEPPLRRRPPKHGAGMRARAINAADRMQLNHAMVSGNLDGRRER